MFVFDSSAYINGSKNHFLPEIMPGVWGLVDQAIEDGRIILPREVYREVEHQDDDIRAFLAKHQSKVVEPSEGVQKRAGEIGAEFPRNGIRNGADPFILAEAEARGFTVVTYEGTNFSGGRAKRWHRSMPSVCDRFDIPCCTLPDALRELGLYLE
ncbi:MAG TPA: DUF4411 family protein [Thermoleophilaceae bacterium]|nr:DUF4411 family protein [Thermoleophilaceae bacterium]